MNKINMTPRERQMRLREAVKEYIAWRLMMSASEHMIVHWIIGG